VFIEAAIQRHTAKEETMTCPRVTRLSLPIALAALLLLPAASGFAKIGTGGSRVNHQRLGVHLPLAICHQYCYGADHWLAAANQRRAEHTRVIAIRTNSTFDRQDAAIGAAAGGGVTLLAVAILTRPRRGRIDQPAKT